MEYTCPNCQAKNNENSVFCHSCGTSVKKKNNEICVKKMVEKEALLPVGPIKFLFEKLVYSFKNCLRIFKNKKKWIPALILGIVWIVLVTLPMFGVEASWVNVLSVLTFARGGFNSGITGAVGGFFGKSIYAFFLASIISPLFVKHKPISSFKQAFSSFLHAFKGEGKTISTLLLGSAIALAFYNFMTGMTSVQGIMAGFAALWLSFRALSENNGFLKGFFSALLNKKGTARTKKNDRIINRLIAGMAFGFALSIPLSAIPYGRTTYIGAGVMLIGSIIFIFIPKGSQGVANE